MKKFLTKENVVNALVFIGGAVLGFIGGAALMAMATPTAPDGGAATGGGYAASGAGVATPTSNRGVSLKGAPASAINEVQGLNVETMELLTPELLQETINPEIVKIRPCNTPLDTILRSAKSRKAEGFEYSWYSTDILPVSSELTSVAQALTNNRMGKKDGVLTVADPSLFSENDTVCVRWAVTASGVTTEHEAVFYVYGVDMTNGTLLVNAGGEDVEAIAAGSFDDGVVYRMGRAHIDGEKQTVNYSALPTKESNYCQIFKWQVSATTLAQLAKKEVKWGLNDIEEQAVIEFKIAQEASFLFGKKAKYYNQTKGAEVYATGGIVDYIATHGKTCEIDTTDETSLIDLMKDVFQGNVGNRKRVLFMGSEFNAALSKMRNVQKQIAANETKEVKGMEFSEIRSNFGSLMCMQHDLFDLYGYSNKAIILDIDNIDKWVWNSKLETISDDPHFDGDTKIFTEVAGVSVRYPATHAIVTLKP